MRVYDLFRHFKLLGSSCLIGLRLCAGRFGSLVVFGLVSILFSSSASAGLFEIGFSGSYRKSTIDVGAYDESESLTGSLSYYLTESSAIELSYTDGTNRRAILEDQPNAHVTEVDYKTVGLDFVYTFGEPSSSFRPYLKAGVNYIIEKRMVDQYRDALGNLYPATIISDNPALVPSAGAGFKISITDALSLKVGVDVWASDAINLPTTTMDYAGRAGISWLF